ncbi:PREDICTED: uncharacterized protein LOC106808981 [Priapulus caudatus]|uniref:Uncharacterized protein LOC106808981 n=1 Tax=Priapulus caudatus TaxID=37621 RepID=A0ABM1E5D3_PRICU|nr:PREDICTED: uncharacterized protein LOC106808981 [Priapulus caudatus]
MRAIKIGYSSGLSDDRTEQPSWLPPLRCLAINAVMASSGACASQRRWQVRFRCETGQPDHPHISRMSDRANDHTGSKGYKKGKRSSSPTRTRAPHQLLAITLVGREAAPLCVLQSPRSKVAVSSAVTAQSRQTDRQTGAQTDNRTDRRTDRSPAGVAPPTSPRRSQSSLYVSTPHKSSSGGDRHCDAFINLCQ